MKTPYISALKRPSCGFSELFRKKETVMGIIGNTHGVRSIRSPQRMASRISPHSPLPSSFSGSAMALWWTSPAGAGSVTVKS